MNHSLSADFLSLVVPKESNKDLKMAPWQDRATLDFPLFEKANVNGT